MKETELEERVSNNVEKRRRLEPGICIRMQNTEMQDGHEVNEMKNAKYNAIIVSLM